MKETTTTCPKCGEDIIVYIEETDDGAAFDSPYGDPRFWLIGIMLDPENQPDCKCAFTDEERAVIEERAALAAEDVGVPF